MCKTIITAFFFALLAPLAAQAEIIEAIKVEGNQRVDTESVKSYLAFTNGDDFDLSAANQSIKRLYATNLFADVSITDEGGIVTVKVVENPIISQIAFEGNRAIDDEKISSEVTLKPRSIYTKAAVNNETQRIAEIYRKNGLYSATIEPKVILKDQNRVDLVFEINEGARAEIQRITFVNNGAFSDKALQAVVRSAETRWYSFFSDDDKYDSDRLEYDKELLRRFYTSKGYADFRVRSAVAELAPQGDGFILTFSLEEGAKYNFGKISVETKIEDLKATDTQEIIKTKEGDEYSSTKVETTVDNLVQKAGEQGYAFVDVDPKITRDPENKIIDIKYVLSEGSKVYVDRINIHGNSRTLDEVVRREFRLAEGDPFNTNLLKRSKQRVENLGFFSTVDVKKQKSSAPDKVDIDVNVGEKSTGEFNFGAGFSTTDGVLGNVALKERNFLGRGQFVNVDVQASTRRQQGKIGFTEPYFLGKPLAAGFDLYAIKRDYQSESSYDQDTKGLNLRTGYEISEHLSHNILYSIVQDDISNVDPAASLFIKQQVGNNLTSMIGHDLVFDYRDNKADPRNGYFFKIGQDFAGLGGDSRFIRHDIGSGYYLPLTEEADWMLNFAFNGGIVNGVGKDVPINHRYFVGGQSFRGFDRAGIGPRDNTTEDALGGKYYYVGTAETIFPLGLPEELGFTGALFADVGSLWGIDGSGVGVTDNASPRVAIGAGLGWKSPFGPIRIDFAVPVVKDSKDELKTFQLNFGTRF